MLPEQLHGWKPRWLCGKSQVLLARMLSKGILSGLTDVLLAKNIVTLLAKTLLGCKGCSSRHAAEQLASRNGC